jgi:hypothetical protein
VQKLFTLQFTLVSGASDPDPAWLLVPLTPTAYSGAVTKLRNNWQDGMMAGSDRREVFVYKKGNATLSQVLADLQAVGIEQDLVEVIN